MVAGGQITVVGWTLIEDVAGARAFAIALRAAPLSNGTTISTPVTASAWSAAPARS